MLDVLIGIAQHVAVVALMAVVFYAWWWETSGRREWERGERRREDVDHRERMREWRRRRPDG